MVDTRTSPADFLETRLRVSEEAGHVDLVKLHRLRGREIREGDHLVAVIPACKPKVDKWGGDNGFRPMQEALRQNDGGEEV